MRLRRLIRKFVLRFKVTKFKVTERVSWNLGHRSHMNPSKMDRGALEATTDFGDARIWSETTRVDLQVAEVANPRPGDRIEIEGDAFLIQGEPVRDRERLVWTVDLRPA